MAGRPPDYAAFDEVVVQRVVADRQPGLKIRPADAGEITRRLARTGFSDGQIAHRLDMTRRSVYRIRVRLAIPAALRVGSTKYDRQHDAPHRPRAKG